MEKKKDTKKHKADKKKEVRISYHKKPDNLSPEQWQEALRKQFAAENPFEIRPIGEHPVYSDFLVFNPTSENTYKVAIRSSPAELANGENRNFCSCYDFKTNGLGTCKHLEAVRIKLFRNTKLRKHFKLEKAPEQAYSSVYLRYTPENRDVCLRIGTEAREAYQQLAKQYFSTEGTLLPAAFATFDTFLAQAKAINPDFRCYEDAMEFVLDVRDRNVREQYLRKHVGSPKSDYFSTLMKATLLPYQREGVWFAANAGRCVIADDMGLGKTIQAIAAAELLKKEFRISQVLIICPTSLKYQWKSEIEKFTDSKAHVIEGDLLRRSEQYTNEDAFYKIVGYHTVGRDLEAINGLGIDLVILDEAQRIKNWKAKTSQFIKRVKSTYAFVLTGTPLENKLEELYSIMQFIDPFLLGTAFNFLRRYQISDETGRAIGYQNLNEIGQRLQHVMIRRKKKDVLKQLPSRQDQNIFVPMTEKQREVHEEYAETVSKLVNKWRKMGFLPEKDRQRLLISLNSMRMACDSTFVIDQKTRHDTKIAELMSLLDNVLEMEDNKIVIFSQWERMTRLVAQELDNRNIKYSYLHGGIQSKDRKDLLTNFTNDPEVVVFLSTDAGGTGLNLQAASYLVNLDIPWNPAVLEQRIARIYRMGQERKVSIMNFVSTGTIEHRMLDVLKFKSSLSEGVLDGGDDSIFMGESRFNQFMKDIESVTDADTATEELSEATQSMSEAEEHEMEEVGAPAQAPTELPNEPSIATAPGTSTEKTPSEAENREEEAHTPAPRTSATALVSSGISFLSQLSETLSNPQATQELMEAITEKDATGQTYLKIPVENMSTVENALRMLGTLFGGK